VKVDWEAVMEVKESVVEVTYALMAQRVQIEMGEGFVVDVEAEGQLEQHHSCDHGHDHGHHGQDWEAEEEVQWHESEHESKESMLV
jgi:hypothetical protein